MSVCGEQINEVRGFCPTSPPDSTSSTLLTHRSSGEHWREKRSTPPHSSTPLPSFTEKPLSRDLSPSWMDHQSRKTLFLLIALDGN
ncbi:hypothetical protein AMECASPLE_007018 [Ameca splendens]|uniref:Uncharacterized protein n=1 Tax=Ameca splendens TaxID=208324 RepID=A0ABV0YLZ7_9TELE